MRMLIWVEFSTKFDRVLNPSLLFLSCKIFPITLLFRRVNRQQWSPPRFGLGSPRRVSRDTALNVACGRRIRFDSHIISPVASQEIGNRGPREFAWELWERHGKRQTQEYPMYRGSILRSGKGPWGISCQESRPSEGSEGDAIVAGWRVGGGTHARMYVRMFLCTSGITADPLCSRSLFTAGSLTMTPMGPSQWEPASAPSLTIKFENEWSAVQVQPRYTSGSVF